MDADRLKRKLCKLKNFADPSELSEELNRRRRLSIDHSLSLQVRFERQYPELTAWHAAHQPYLAATIASTPLEKIEDSSPEAAIYRAQASQFQNPGIYVEEAEKNKSCYSFSTKLTDEIFSVEDEISNCFYDKEPLDKAEALTRLRAVAQYLINEIDRERISDREQPVPAAPKDYSEAISRVTKSAVCPGVSLVTGPEWTEIYSNGVLLYQYPAANPVAAAIVNPGVYIMPGTPTFNVPLGLHSEWELAGWDPRPSWPPVGDGYRPLVIGEIMSYSDDEYELNGHWYTIPMNWNQLPVSGITAANLVRRKIAVEEASVAKVDLQRPEEKHGCGRMRDIGSKCWWCGGA